MPEDTPLKRFLSKLGEWININELVFDLTVSLAALIVYRLIVPNAGFFTLNLPFLPMLIIVICVQFFTALFFTGIIKQYTETEKQSRILNFFLTVFLFIGVNGLFFLMPNDLMVMATAIASEAGREDANMFLIFPVLCLTGFTVIMAGVLVFKGTEDLMRWFGITLFPSLIWVITWIITIVYFAYNAGFLGVVLFIVLSSGLVAGIVLLKKHFYDLDKDPPLVIERLKPVLNRYVIPFLTALALIVWHELILVSSANQLIFNDIPVNMANIFPLLLLSGFLPVRALIMFSPPVRPLNIVISLASFYFYFTSLETVLGRLTEAVLK